MAASLSAEFRRKLRRRAQPLSNFTDIQYRGGCAFNGRCNLWGDEV